LKAEGWIKILKIKPPEEFKAESRNVFSRLAGTYDRILVLERPVHNRIVEKLSLVTYHSVLDVGCGTGALLSLIAKKKLMSSLQELILPLG